MFKGCIFFIGVFIVVFGVGQVIVGDGQVFQIIVLCDLQLLKVYDGDKVVVVLNVFMGKLGYEMLIGIFFVLEKQKFY